MNGYVINATSNKHNATRNEPEQDIYRVLEAWNRMVENQPFEDKDTQRFATSFIDGLEAKPWHEVDK